MSGTDLQIETSTRRAYCPDCGEEFPADHDHCPHDGTLLYRYNGPNDEDHLLGESLDGRFELHKVLGEGGMGKVYAGTQLSVGRDVAIKVLRRELSNDQEIVKRFFREGRVISGLSHHNIVNLVDFGQDPESGVLFLAMEMLDGRDMSELLEGQRMKLPLALECVRQTCAGLSQAHEQQVVHRDLKPENLFIVPGSDGSVQVKILDFGIARALQTNTKLTKTGMVFGTPQYMPPEQSTGGDVGPHTDVYALGVILFEALTGRLPFDGETPAQVMLAHIQFEPPSLRNYLGPAEVPDEVVQLVDSMLAKDPTERPQSVLDVRDAIETVQRDHRMMPVRVQTHGEFDERFAPLVEPAKGERDDTTSGRLRIDTGNGARKHRTDPLESPAAFGTADTAAFDEAPSETEPVFETEEWSPRESHTRLYVVAAVVFLLVAAAGGTALFLMSSKLETDASEQDSPAVVAAAERPEKAAEKPAEPAAGQVAAGELTAAIGEASAGMFSARTTALQTVDDAATKQPESAAPPARRVERKPDRTSAASAEPAKTTKPATTSPPRPTRQPTVVKPTPTPKSSDKSSENDSDSLNFFPVE